jgi:hypothetical protein
LYVDLGRAGGFLEVVDKSGFDKEVEEWLFSDRTWSPAADPLFVDGMVDVLSSHLGNFSTKAVSFREFLRMPSLYGTTGSSTRKRKLVNFGRVLTLRNKWVLTHSVSVPQLERNVARAYGRPQGLRVIEKREQEKIRPVVGDSDERYLVGKYLLHHMMSGSSAEGPLTLFWGNERYVDHFSRVRTGLRAGRWSCPVDIAGFDQWVSLGCFMAALKAIEIAVSRWCGVSSGDLWSQDPRTSVTGAATWLVDTPRSELNGRLVTSGMISGLILTSLVDSLINVGIARYITRIRNIVLLSPANMGDDADGSVSSHREAVSLFVGYEAAEVPMNAKKNFASRVGDEYLRFVSTRDATFGYLGRAIGTLLFRSPLTSDSGEGELDEVIGRWATVHARGLSWGVVKVWLVEELVNRGKLSHDQVLELLATPRAMGGLGHIMFRQTGALAIRRSVTRRVPRVVPVRDSALDVAVGSSLASMLHSEDKTAIVVGPAPSIRARDLGGDLDPIKPEWNRGIDPMIGGEELRRRVLDKVPIGVDLVSNSDELVTISKRMSRRVFIDWLMGKLRVPTPAGIILADQSVSLVTDRVQRRAMSALLSLRNSTVSAWRGIALTAERQIRSALTSRQREQDLVWLR